ncbi:hypothetical protein D9C73_023869 [Collichthys lucidus]|uniref:Uncharacterized protein n=1 Tax=Collichthys lucidus TaxID=240159 RepID=A0A4U5VNT9_COLLU|nr:hypothetical protein D9C73_023869 [Collichthys lucidus]
MMDKLKFAHEWKMIVSIRVRVNSCVSAEVASSTVENFASEALLGQSHAASNNKTCFSQAFIDMGSNVTWSGLAVIKARHFSNFELEQGTVTCGFMSAVKKILFTYTAIDRHQRSDVV